MNYNKKLFRAISNTQNGDTSSETIFEYIHHGNVLSSNYSGGKILVGHLIGIVNEQGLINMRYHHINSEGELMTGICISNPEMLPNGKVRLHEKWRWTTGDCSEGESILEEI
ncbi:MAG: n-acetylglutamate synthase [Leadbetterella sp.]|nr:n-acetylglutamate synthase [Leadbetterella sp.]